MKQTLEAILANHNAVERMKALGALGETMPAESLGALIGFLDSPGKEIRRRAASALSSFKSSALIEQYAEVFAAKLQHHEDEWVRLACAIYLMSAPSPVAESAYLRALQDPFVKVVQIACVQAASYGERGRQALLEILKHPSWRVRLEACKALITQRTADQRVVETLEKMKSEPEAAVYDAECDELDAMCGELDELVKQECGEPHPRWNGRWGKLDPIIVRAREVVAGSSAISPSPNL